MSGVYVIINTVNGSRYFGSSVNPTRRFRRHRYELRKRIHCNQHLQSAWNLYGEASFRLQVIPVPEIALARTIEAILLRKFAGRDGCYNIALSVDNPNTGRRLSEAHKARIGAANKIALSGRKASLEHRRNQALAQVGLLRGRKLSSEHRDKLRIAKLGKPAPWNKYPRSAQHRAKISLAMKGKPWTEAAWLSRGLSRSGGS